MRWFSLPAALLVVAAVSGCGGDLPRSSVHGKVTYQGKAVSGGTVIFLSKDNMTHLADIQPDGTYTVQGVPQGAVKVSVQQPPPRPAPRPAPVPGKDNSVAAADDEARRKGQADPPPAARSAGQLPPRYSDPAQSGLAFDLMDADQEFPIDLK